MANSIDELWSMPEPALIGAYADARRRFVEKKFARDTRRARLEWIKAKMFIGGSGGVTERNMAIDVSEEIARKGAGIARDDARPRPLESRHRRHRDGRPPARRLCAG